MIRFRSAAQLPRPRGRPSPERWAAPGRRRRHPGPRSRPARQVVRTGPPGPVGDAFLELLRLGALVSLDRVLLADGLAELVLRGVLLDLGLRLLGLLIVVLLIVGLLVVVLGLVVVLLGVVLLVVVLRLVVILLVAGLFPGLENGVDRRAHLAQLRVEGVAGAVGLTQVTVSDEI